MLKFSNYQGNFSFASCRHPLTFHHCKIIKVYLAKFPFVKQWHPGGGGVCVSSHVAHKGRICSAPWSFSVWQMDLVWLTLCIIHSSLELECGGEGEEGKEGFSVLSSAVPTCHRGQKLDYMNLPQQVKIL
jgi:hypothetical protein